MNDALKTEFANLQLILGAVVVRTYSSTAELEAPHNQVFELVRSPRAFIPLWPFLIGFNPSTNTVRLRLKRFGFSLTVDYHVRVTVDETSGTVVYQCTAPGKMFTLTVSVKPSEKGSRVEIEASYSGDYERFSQPLLKEFVEELASRLKGLEALKPSAGIAASPLSDPTFVARAIVSGKIVLNEAKTVSTPAEAAELIQKLASLSKGKRLLARITFNNKCARLLFADGNPVDAILEHEAGSEQGLQVVEKLVEVLRGRASILAVEL